MKLEFLKSPQLEFLKEGVYIEPNETPQERFEAILSKVKEYEPLYSEGLTDRLRYMMDNNILSLSTPALSNFGRPKSDTKNTYELPASCNIITVDDSIASIAQSNAEVKMLSKLGAGVGSNYTLISSKGTKVSEGFYTNSKLDWIEDDVSSAQKISQGAKRRGYNTPFIDIEDADFDELMRRIDKNNPDKEDPLISNTVGIILPIGFRDKLKTDKEAQRRYIQVLKARQKTGKVYMLDTENCMKNNSPVYKKLGYDKWSTNICCVTGDTQILTSKGNIPIINLIGKEIEVWNGEEFSKVTPYKTSYSSDIYEVVFNGGQTLQVTDYHNFYIQEGYSRGGKVVKKYTLGLKEGDKLIKFKLPVIEGNLKLNYAYTQGFYSGDKCNPTDYRQDNHQIVLYDEKQKLVPYIDVRNKKVSRGKDRGVYTNEPYISKITENKTICFLPEDLNTDKSFVPNSLYLIKDRLDWLAGILDSDGTVLNTLQKGVKSVSLQLASTNLIFLNKVQLMLQTLGLNAKIKLLNEEGFRKLPDNKGTNGTISYLCKATYRITITPNDTYKLLDLGLNCKRLVIDKVKPKRNAQVFTKVFKVTKLDKKEPTYCFTEPKRGMGMFNGVLTGQCEFIQPLFPDMTSVCVISALNANHWDEIKKDPQMIKDAFMFLDIMNEEYIKLTEDVPFMQRARKAAMDKRDIGLGLIGFAELLQSKAYAYGDMYSRALNIEIFSIIRKYGEEYALEMGEKLGSPAICREAGMVRRNASLIMVAPNKSTSFISGATSGGIEPFMSNMFFKSLAKIQYVFKNPHLEKLLKAKGKDTLEVWDSIQDNNGSVQHLEFLTDHEKNVFKTFTEISPKDLIDLASDRQKYIDMGQSLNLVFRKNYTLQDIIAIHKYAWEKDIKTLYYAYPSAHAALEKDGESWDSCVSCAD